MVRWRDGEYKDVQLVVRGRDGKYRDVELVVREEMESTEMYN